VRFYSVKGALVMHDIVIAGGMILDGTGATAEFVDFDNRGRLVRSGS
jgi:hypothetical protein